MKITCPICSKKLYTNPFASNKEIDCPYCNHHLVRSEQTNQLLKLALVVDIVTYAIIAYILSVFFPQPSTYLIVMACFACEYMFEIPQKSLQRIGKLIYEVKDDETH